MNTPNSKTVYILLTRQPDRFSRLFLLVSASTYSHVSIGLEEEKLEFYSFVTRGFRTERIRPRPEKARGEMRCLLCQIEVSEEVFQNIQRRIAGFEARENALHYSFIGVLLCLLGIPHRIKNRYFCSQFVSEVLEESGAARLCKRPSLCLPDDFVEEGGFLPKFQGTVSELAAFTGKRLIS